MAHFAEFDDNNIVLRVIVVSNDDAPDEAAGIEFCRGLLGGNWKQTSYNTQAGVHTSGGTPLRKNYAGVGYCYDEVRDAFIPPSPFPSWIVNDDRGIYEAPVPRPTGADYIWNEITQTWDNRE